MIKITDKLKEEIIESCIRGISYAMVAGLGWKLNFDHMNSEIERNSKMADLEKELLSLKKSKLRSEISELKNK